VGARPDDQVGLCLCREELRRGQTLEQAKEVFRGTADDVQASPIVLRDARAASRRRASSRRQLLRARIYDAGRRPAGEAQPAAQILPVGIVDGRLLVALSQDWQSFKTDSVISYDLNEWKRDPNAAPALARLGAGRAPDLRRRRDHQGRADRHHLDNVRGRAWEMNYANGRWTTKPIALPANSTIGIAAASDETNEAMFSVADYLTPTTLWYYNGDTASWRR
jgi:prolyl oligopeptidase